MGTLCEDLCKFMIISRWIQWEMFHTKVAQKIKTHTLCSVTFSQQSCYLWDNVEKYGIAEQATDNNMVHALCMFDN